MLSVAQCRNTIRGLLNGPSRRHHLVLDNGGDIAAHQVASRVRTARTLSGAPAAGSGREAGAPGAPSAAGNGAAENFTLSAHQDLGESITLRSLLQLCLQENERRLAPYDRRLARPRLVPAMVRWAHRLTRLWP